MGFLNYLPLVAHSSAMENTNADLLDMQELILIQEIEAKTQELRLLRLRKEYLKSLNKISDQQRVDPTPCSEKSKNVASPVTLSTGKDGLNPCVDSLHKTVRDVQTSENVSKKALMLKPNGGIQIPEKSIDHPIVRPVGVKNYYVVFNGPYPGIYTSWNIAEKAVKGHSNVQHRRFKDYAEAKAAAAIFTNNEQKAPLELILDDSRIDPYKTALEKITNLKVIGKKVQVAKHQLEFPLEDDMDFNVKVENSYEDFSYVYSIARRATPRQFELEHFYTTDKTNISYINAFPLADPDLIYESYSFGLLNTVYPSEKMEEIKLFPEQFTKAVIQFKKKCLSKEQQVFIKFQSTIGFWEGHEDMENFISPYHYVNIGAVKERIYFPSKEINIILQKEDLKQIAEEKALNIIERLFTLQEEAKIHVNMATYTVLVTSFSHKGMTTEDKKKLEAFKERIISPLAFGRHEESFCERKKKLLARLGVQYSCKFCQKKTEDNGASASTLTSGSPASNMESILSL
ncbi:caulimovirus viroplasmin [Angelica bushy stunt virus]|uniref:Transactivator/viroplasmin protein n=1 Tax=Angelica bushy stunt virus TaxID=1808970 RepID=A0A140GL63_9VIRU|nr:caulimovirus viroplasmin [Angelica bushy stunt virus]AMN10081.1 caulimovirus viroplasmin [Angelica bushy stunt virus]